MSHSRGSQIAVLAPRSKLYRGPFGRLFSNLEPWAPGGVPPGKLESHFTKVGNELMTERPGAKPDELTDKKTIKALDKEFGAKDVPAGYTYFGQFVDHDITFDPTPLSARSIDPNGLDNFRTPRLDLDNVYGTGPDDQPYMYDECKQKFIIGKIKDTELLDLPRNANGRAIIGDMRNDENSIVAQTQLAFLLAHNCLVERAKKAYMANPFSAARKTLTWLYQWVVWNDFLSRVTTKKVWDEALKKKDSPAGLMQWETGFDNIYQWNNTPFMPIEFSVAAYRFGHSMVRNSYQTNFSHNNLDSIPIFNNVSGSKTKKEVDLRGFRPLVPENTIQWDWFLQMKTSQDGFPQMSRKIDTRLSNALLFLAENDGKPSSFDNKLAARNLLRSVKMELPSGSDVAKTLGVFDKKLLAKSEPDALWFYVLKEAEKSKGKLGVLGSTIVCSVFAGLLKGDPSSWVNLDPAWHPDNDPLLKPKEDNVDGSDWGLPSIIRLSGLPTNKDEF